MSETKARRLVAAARVFELRAEGKDRSRSVNPHEGQRGFLAQKAIEERAQAVLLREVAATTERVTANGRVGPFPVLEAALALADLVLS